MTEIAYQLGSGVDRIRARLLQLGMRIPALRAVYVHRSTRLFALFGTVSFAALLLALHFPLWMLALAPLILGTPHLIASLRYFPGVRRKSPPQHTLFGILGFSFLLLGGLRVLPLLGVHLEGLNTWLLNQRLEAVGLVAIFFISARALGLNRRQTVAASWGVFPFLVAWALSPMVTLGLFVLGHHFVGFGYWILAARTSAEKRGAWLSLVLFAGVHAVVLAGFLDSAISVSESLLEIPAAGITLWNTGAPIFPNAAVGSPFWMRALVLYAFGQSVHYFVWLRAIPESYLPNETPTSFRQSLALFRGDFGSRLASGLMVLICALTGVWALVAWPLARALYAAVAAFHGYAELAGLGLLTVRRK